MLNSPVFDVVVGILFIYLLYSLLASLIGEIIATNLALRSRLLEVAIERMLNDDKNRHIWQDLGMFLKDRFKTFLNVFYDYIPVGSKKPTGMDKTLAGMFYRMPLIKYLGAGRLYQKPAYMGKVNFSKNTFDLLRELGSQLLENRHATSLEKIQAALGLGPVSDLPHPLVEPDTAKYLRSLLEDSNNDLDKFRASLENWFDTTMQQASGWYKNHMQIMLFFIGLTLAVVFNLDTVEIVTRLSKDDDARKEMVEMASGYMKSHTVVRTKPMGKDIVVDSIVYNKRMDSLTRAIDSLLAKDIKNANAIVALGWDIPVDFNECKKIYKTKEDSLSNARCIQCLNEVKCEDQTASSNLTKGQRMVYVKCLIMSDPMKLFGFFITALAISLGAPFWFDMLKKIMQLRGSGGKYENNTPASSVTDNTSVKRIG